MKLILISNKVFFCSKSIKTDKTFPLYESFLRLRNFITTQQQTLRFSLRLLSHTPIKQLLSCSRCLRNIHLLIGAAKTEGQGGLVASEVGFDYDIVRARRVPFVYSSSLIPVCTRKETQTPPRRPNRAILRARLAHSTLTLFLSHARAFTKLDKS